MDRQERISCLYIDWLWRKSGQYSQVDCTTESLCSAEQKASVAQWVRSQFMTMESAESLPSLEASSRQLEGPRLGGAS
eukprot:60522-Rhodomonas_salina.3